MIIKNWQINIRISLVFWVLLLCNNPLQTSWLHTVTHAHRFCGSRIRRWRSRENSSLLHSLELQLGGLHGWRWFCDWDRGDLKIHSPTCLAHGLEEPEDEVMWSTLLWSLASSQHGYLPDTAATTAEGSRKKVPANQAETALPFITQPEKSPNSTSTKFYSFPAHPAQKKENQEAPPLVEKCQRSRGPSFQTCITINKKLPFPGR